MNFKQLEAFYWLTQLHSYQKVADHIGLTQPAVSARISGLEDMLNVQLIDRASPGFQLTEHGHHVAEYAEMFLNLREAMTNRLMARQKRRYTIGIVGMVAMTWGTTLRRKLADWDPNLLVDFHSASNLELRQQVRSGVVDMAFVTGEADLPYVPGSFSVNYRVGWAARPDVAGGITRPRTPDEIRQLPLILYPRTSPLYDPVAEMVAEQRVRPGPRHSANSLSGICDMIRAGYGASALPLAALEAELLSGLLVEIPSTVQLAALEIRCVHLNRARKQLTEEIFGLARQAAQEWCAAHPRYLGFDPGH